jgi:hypothetical protein
MSVFPISYWHGVPADRATLKDFELVAEAGFSIAQVGGTSDQIRQGLDWCESLGITAMVQDHRMPHTRQPLPDDWKERLAGIVADYRGHSALWGYYIGDEPSVVEYEKIRAITDELRRLDPESPSYVNLYPNYANEAQLGCPTYDEHVRRYVDEVQPPLVSYDHYAFHRDSVHREVCFENLRVVREHAMRAGLDFWQIVLSSQLFNWPELSEADMRWQVWTTLAYGARGISYYVYSAIDGTMPHWNAIVDQYGYPTERYPVMRRINKGVAALGPHLMKLRSLGVTHGSETEGKTFGEGGVLSAPPSERLVVGEFARDDGGAAMIVVNDQLDTGIHTEFEVNERFTSWRHVDRVSGKVGGSRTMLLDGDGPSLDLRLAPGDGALIFLEM